MKPHQRLHGATAEAEVTVVVAAEAAMAEVTVVEAEAVEAEVTVVEAEAAEAEVMAVEAEAAEVMVVVAGGRGGGKRTWCRCRFFCSGNNCNWP
jgi:hypothetical protein